MKLEIHVHLHMDETLSLVKEIHSSQLKQGVRIMALSAKMQQFVDASTAAFTSAGQALNNIREDVRKLVENASGGELSEEDSNALDAVTNQLVTLQQNLEEAAAVTPDTV